MSAAVRRHTGIDRRTLLMMMMMNRHHMLAGGWLKRSGFLRLMCELPPGADRALEEVRIALERLQMAVETTGSSGGKDHGHESHGPIRP